jgi:hypothetical protein
MLSEMKNEREFDLLVAPASMQGERTDTTSRHDDRKSYDRKDQRLRAILRAPDDIQQLYLGGLISQESAALLGPGPSRKDAGREKRVKAALEKYNAWHGEHKHRGCPLFQHP